MALGYLSTLCRPVVFLDADTCGLLSPLNSIFLVQTYHIRWPSIRVRRSVNLAFASFLLRDSSLSLSLFQRHLKRSFSHLINISTHSALKVLIYVTVLYCWLGWYVSNLLISLVGYAFFVFLCSCVFCCFVFYVLMFLCSAFYNVFVICSILWSWIEQTKEEHIIKRKA